MARLTRLKTESRRVAGEISALGNEAKAAGGANYWKGIKAVHDLNKLDKAEAIEFLGGLVEIAAQNEIRITWMGSQASFTDVMDANTAPAKNTTGSRDLATAKAEAAGFKAGKNGQPPHDNPHSPGTEEYVNWHDGRDEGQRVRDAKKPGEAERVSDAATADATLPDEGKGLEGTF